MATGDEVRKSFASDEAAYSGGVQLRQIGGNDASALASVITNPKKAKPTAIVKTAVSSADVSTKTAAAIDIGNRPHVNVDIEFTTATGSITIVLAKYDINSAFCGFTNQWTFQSLNLPRNGAAGKYCSEGQVFDVGTAAWVEPFVLAINDTSVDIFVSVL